MSQKKIKEARRIERDNFQENNRGSYTSLWVSLVVAVLVLWGGWQYLYGNNNNNNNDNNMNNEIKQTQQDVVDDNAQNINSTTTDTDIRVGDTQVKNEEIQVNKVVSEKQQVVIETNKGKIVVELRADKAPKTVQNFLDLVAKKFYDGLKFHRVEPGFVIQGGDPKGNGTGGSGTNIPLEITCEDGTLKEGVTVTCPVALPHTDGALAMARSSDPDSASSQFYITNGDQVFLNGNYAVFGYVVEGLDIVREIEVGDSMEKVYVR